ncbi:acyl-CoA dehydrogenase [Burkholderia pseudomallei]|nr:acyl-CoA dehydrogenase [Burkholderia pseudomallei]
MKRFDAETGNARVAAVESLLADDHTLNEAARRVAQVAARFADTVDRDARFPTEAVDAMREERLLGALVPIELGGRGASLAAVAAACRIIGQACSSAAMIYAMHQTQVASIVDHALSSDWHRRFAEQLAEREWLLASATSEEEVGGNLRNSRCAIEADGDMFTLAKLAPTISYGAQADAILVTARRDRDAPAAEQVLVTLLKENATLTRRSGWDTFGMRGTCSEGFALDARGYCEQIFPVPFAQIAERTMVPTSHILWAAVWTGIANDAFLRAHQFFRAQMQKQGGALPPSGRRIADALALLQAMQARIDGALRAARAQRVALVVRDDGAGGRDQHAEDLRIDDRARGGQARDDDLRNGVVQERHAVHARAPHSRPAFGAAHDQQRPHRGEHGQPVARTASRHA